MSARVPSNSHPISPRERWLVLAMVNTLQPVEPDTLFQSLSTDLNQPRLDRVLKVLSREEMVLHLENGEYVVSHLGLTAFGNSPLAKARDISRMFHLGERSKGRGG